ncbi:hypothetical protein EVG20_g10817 [Dentipellis fragilis]|uniref:Uncharacterized protein n=1 Tax=Dentipellis fragilis TaxID=205917 RepID=A0A4Y9XND8_9AGAM|nr:hypothetical protein EVG20_g10817 [Dentipellis fragilis]
MPDDSTAPRVTKLNDVNYAEWSMGDGGGVGPEGAVGCGPGECGYGWEGQIYLEGRVGQGHCEESPTKMAEARAEMILCIEAGQLPHMQSWDPMEVWQVLEHLHHARGFATSLALRRHFLMVKKKSGQPMQAWIGDIRSQVFNMEAVGIAVSEQDRILALTMGLPEAYALVIINFDATPPDQLMFDTVITCLLNEETQQSSVSWTGSYSRQRMVPDSDADKGNAIMARGGPQPSLDSWEEYKKELVAEANAAIKNGFDSDDGGW